MGGTVRLVSPIGEVVAEKSRPATRLSSLTGRNLALMDNMKSNADVLLERIGAALRGEHAELTVKRFRKTTNSALPYAPAVFEEVRHHFDAGIVGVGD